MEGQHVRIPPQMREAEMGGEGRNYPCVFLPSGAEDGEMTDARLSGSST